MAYDVSDLRGILEQYGVPDPSLVVKLNKRYKDKNGNWRDLWIDYVGHADITRILIEIDPEWNWEPVAWTDNGRPATTTVNGNVAMWARLTVLGKTILGVGTAAADKSDVDKELIGDFLRNASMRLGIALKLWSKAEWDEQQTQPAQSAQPAWTHDVSAQRPQNGSQRPQNGPQSAPNHPSAPEEPTGPQIVNLDERRGHDQRPTEKQIDTVKRMMAERNIPDHTDWSTKSRLEVSNMIETLKNTPRA